MKTIFWNVDTQYDFMRDDESHKGLLPIQNAREIEGNLALLTTLAKVIGYQVVNTADYHTSETKEISANPDYINTFPAHCMQNSLGAKFIPATRPIEPCVIDWNNPKVDLAKIITSKDIVMYKDAFDIFAGNPYADKVVKTLAPNRAVVYGVATNVCVDYAVKGLLARKIEVYVPLDAIKGLPHLPLQPVLDEWANLGAKLVTTKYVEDKLI